MAGRGKRIQQLLDAVSSNDSGHAEQKSDEKSGSSETGSGKRDDVTELSKGTISEVTSDEGTSCRPLPARGRGRQISQLLEMARKKEEAVEFDDVKDIPQDIVPKMEELQVSEEPPKFYRGEKGVTVKVAVNYIRMKLDPDKGVFEYEVRFVPAIMLRTARFKLLNQLKELIGDAKTFDGVVLYLPIKLASMVTTGMAKDHNGAEIKVDIIYKRKKKLSECVHLYNVLIDRVMRMLKYVRHNNKKFDPSKPMMIPQYKLEIWPGYVTAVEEYEDGVMLNLDVSFRVLNTRTVLDVLRESFESSRSGNYKDAFEKAILGNIVLTRYNNKTYRVDEILWDLNPMSSFSKSTGSEITFKEYYKQNYDIDIKDLKQPLLLHIEERRVDNQVTPESIRLCIIPEICYLTGLSDAQRNDFKVMKDVAAHTRISPNQRVHSLRLFLDNVKKCPEAVQLFASWGITMAEDIERLTARKMDEEQIIFGKNSCQAGPNADFNRDLTNNEVIEAVDLDKWLLIYTKRDSNTAKKFIDLAMRNGRPMGIRVQAPETCELSSDGVDAYVQALRKNIRKQLQIVVTLCPTARDDRYAAIKRICCVEMPIASQVINSRTLANDQKARGIAQKILLQMNCKMGGTLWKIRIPLKNVMIVGIDTYHEPKGGRGGSVGAMVASLNPDFTKWYSRAVMQSKNEELINGLQITLACAVASFEKSNGTKPNRIIVFRDGVSDGQLQYVRDYEIRHLKGAFKDPDYNPEITFIVVQKRINARIMLENASKRQFENPLPGTVLDHTVTRRHLYDFFLVPQSVRQGTVTPTHFIVVLDEAKMGVDIVQRLAYKLCFMYYNWPGTVRVPACCQYAHKLASIVGQHIKKPTAECLSDRLFYL